MRAMAILKFGLIVMLTAVAIGVGICGCNSGALPAPRGATPAQLGV